MKIVVIIATVFIFIITQQPLLFSNASDYLFLKEQANKAGEEVKYAYERLQKCEKSLKESIDEVINLKQSLKEAIDKIDKARADVTAREKKIYSLRTNAEKLRSEIQSLNEQIHDLEVQIKTDDRDEIRQKLTEAKAQLGIQNGNLERTLKETDAYEKAFESRSEIELLVKQADSNLPILERRIESNRRQLNSARTDYDRAVSEFQQILVKTAGEAPEDPPFVREVQISTKGKVVYKGLWEEQTGKEKNEIEKFRRMEAAIEGFRTTAKKLNEAISPLMERITQANGAIYKDRIEILETENDKELAAYLIDGLSTVIMAPAGLTSLAEALLNNVVEQAASLVFNELWKGEKGTAPNDEAPETKEVARDGLALEILDGKPWREVLDEVFRINGLEDLKTIEQMSEPKSWAVMRLSAINFVDNLEDKARPYIGELIEKAGKDAISQAKRMAIEKSPMGKAVLKKAREKTGLKFESIGPSDIAQTFGLSFGRELLIYHLYEKGISVPLRKRILEEETYREGLTSALRSIEIAIDIINKKIWDGQEILRQFEEGWRKQQSEGGDKRALKKITNEKAEENRDYEIEIRFTLPAQVLSVKLGSRLVPGQIAQGFPKIWKGKARIGSFKDSETKGGSIPIMIEARDQDGRFLDADPSTAAYRDKKEPAWNAYESKKDGPDTHKGGIDCIHSVSLVREAKEKDEKGLSIAFLIDCSGSMKDDNKLENAKKAAQAAINKLNGVFEIAVIAFFDCGSISVLQGFTDNKQAVINTILALRPNSATPLAEAIAFGHKYLMSNAKYENKSLIVLTDGIETCGGNPNTCLPSPSLKEKEEEKSGRAPSNK